MGFSKVHRSSFAAFTVAALVLASCGGDDDDNAAGASNEQTATADTAGDTGGGADIPQECKDLLGDYLEKLEPIVKDVDWESANLDQLDQIQNQMGTDFDSLDSEITDKCADYDFTTSTADMEQAIDIARDRAPGTVAWLQFIQRVSQAGSDFSVPGTTVPAGDTGGAAAGDLPTDCAGAKAFIEGLMAEHDTMMDLSGSEQVDLGQVSVVIFDTCPGDDAFFSRADVTKFMGG